MACARLTLGLVFLAILAPLAPAHAETWVTAGSTEFGDISIDRDSITSDADGLTRFHQSGPVAPGLITEVKINCAQDFSAEKVTLMDRTLVNPYGAKRLRDWQSKETYVSSLAGQAAKFVCQK